MRIQASLAIAGLIFATTLGSITATQALSNQQSANQPSGSELAYRGSGRMES